MKSIQTAQPKKESRPKSRNIEQRKAIFISSLRINGGVVSDALRSSGLARRTAYEHFRSDIEFAADWQEALEQSHDELFAEARRRAIEGEEMYRNQAACMNSTYRKKSDALLIFLLKNAEIRMKWRARLIQTGNLALETVSSVGLAHSLTKDQIAAIQGSMVEEFEKISLK